MERLSFDDETLMAYADGQIDPAIAAQIDKALQTDTQLAARVALFRETGALAKQALDEMLSPKVPASLEASVRAAIARHADSRGHDLSPLLMDQDANAESETIPLQSVAKASWFARTLGVANVSRFAMAASVGAFAIGFLGYLIGSNQSIAPSVATANLSGIAVTQTPQGTDAFTKAMNETSSGASRQIADGKQSTNVELVATFKDNAGTVCREFKAQRTNDALSGVACKANDQWTVTFATAIPKDQSTYTPVSSEAALDAYLGSINAGEPLSVEDERKALGMAGSP